MAASPAKRPRKAAPPKPPAPVVEAPAPVGLVEAITGGDRRAGLTALRDELARRLAAAESEVPGLARQLQSVLRELSELPAPAERSALDEISQRRSARRAASNL